MRTAIIGIVCFVFGAGLLYGWNEYNKVRETNTLLQKELDQITTAPTTPDQRVPTAITPEDETGTVTGTLGYPSEGIPPLFVYAINADDDTQYSFIETEQNNPSFTMTEMKPGTYYFVAYMKDNAAFAGGYTKAVPCGLSVACTDHSLIPVTIDAGATATGVEIKDWYAPDGTFPTKPE